MGILSPIPGDEGEYWLARADNHVRIVGTAERMCVCYPLRVTKADDGAWGWEYSGGDPKEYDETAEQEADENGEPLFQDEDGNDVPASQIVIMGEDDEGDEIELGRLAEAPTPAKPGALAAAYYAAHPTGDDASLIARLDRWLAMSPDHIRASAFAAVARLTEEA